MADDTQAIQAALPDDDELDKKDRPYAGPTRPGVLPPEYVSATSVAPPSILTKQEANPPATLSQPTMAGPVAPPTPNTAAVKLPAQSAIPDIPISAAKPAPVLGSTQQYGTLDPSVPPGSPRHLAIQRAIHSPIARIAGEVLKGIGKVGSTAIDVAAPWAGVWIPGTQTHQMMEDNRAQSFAAGQSEDELRKAQANEANARAAASNRAPVKETTPEQTTFDYLVKQGMSPDKAFEKIKQLGVTEKNPTTPEMAAYEALIAQGVHPDDALDQVMNSVHKPVNPTAEESAVAALVKQGMDPFKAYQKVKLAGKEGKQLTPEEAAFGRAYAAEIAKGVDPLTAYNDLHKGQNAGLDYSQLPGGGQVTGEDFAKLLPAGEAAMVRKITQYEVDPKEATSMRGNDREKLYAEATLFDPNFDPSQYKVRYDTKKDYATGKTRDNIIAINKTIGHMDSLYQSASALMGTDLHATNYLAQGMRKFFGTETLARFNQDVNAVSDEMSRVFKGTNSSDQEIKSWKENLSAENTNREFKGAIGEGINLLASQLEALQEKYVSTMGSPDRVHFLDQDKAVTLLKVAKATGNEEAANKMLNADGYDPEALVKGPSPRTPQGDLKGRPGQTRNNQPATPPKWNPVTGKYE